jgi:hypothetical protein
MTSFNNFKYNHLILEYQILNDEIVSKCELESGKIKKAVSRKAYMVIRG